MNRTTFLQRTALFLILVLFSLPLISQELKTGEQAPEINQKLITGEEFQLSDLRGKIVLIDFWAAWCKPCRKANPEIVKLYHKYKDKEFDNADGFTIVSVSLDFKREMWENAIEVDKLDWPYHVGGESGWKNPAAKRYQVKSIPNSFLVDGDGKLLGMNLRGEEIEDILKEERKGGFFLFF
jgi:thiol-disulfide isomerase/thioredoxin